MGVASFLWVPVVSGLYVFSMHLINRVIDTEATRFNDPGRERLFTRRRAFFIVIAVVSAALCGLSRLASFRARRDTGGYCRSPWADRYRPDYSTGPAAAARLPADQGHTGLEDVPGGRGVGGGLGGGAVSLRYVPDRPGHVSYRFRVLFPGRLYPGVAL